MLLSSEIHSELTGPWADKGEEVRWARIRADLDTFVAGGLISVARCTFKARTAYIAQLCPATDEIWETRHRDPRPGVRLFGRFAEKDVFVALKWHYRAKLKGKNSLEWTFATE